MSKRKVRAGIVGTSDQGPSANHAKWLLAHPDVTLVGVADYKRHVAARFAQEHAGECRSYGSLTEMRRAQELDLVFVCVPDANHAEVALEAIEEAGAAVALEKPPAENAGQFLQVVESAERNEKLVYVLFRYMHMLQETVARLLSPEHVGEEVGAIPLVYTGWDRRRNAPTHRPGALDPMTDLGCHLFPVAMRIMGWPNPLRISGKAWITVADTSLVNLGGPANPGAFRGADTCHAIVDFDDLLRSRLEVSASFMGNVIRDEAVVLDARGAKIGIHHPFVAGLRNPAEFLPSLPGEKLGGLLDTTVSHPRPPTDDDGYRAQVWDVMRCLRGEAEPPVSLRRALMIQRILDGYRESADLGGDFVYLNQ